MDDELDSLLEPASSDARATVEQLLGAGFVEQLLDRSAAYGNVQTTFRRGQTVVVVTCDRGQWHLAVGRGDIEPTALRLLLIARGEMEVRRPSRRARFAEQTPAGVAWETAVPPTLAWIEGGDRHEEIASAADAWARLRPGRHSVRR